MATPSNSVQVAFGRDADRDGVLQVDEAALTVGWRCGAWFVRDELSGEETAEARPCGSRQAVCAQGGGRPVRPQQEGGV